MSDKIIDDYLYVNSANDLAKYIEKRFHGDLFIEYIDESTLVGYADDIQFKILFEKGKKMVLAVVRGCDEVREQLRKIVTPVMWYKDPSLEGIFPGNYPLVSYDSDDYSVVEWQYESPERRMKNIMFDKVKGVFTFDNIKLTFPPHKLEEFEEDIKYGSYSGFIPSDALEIVNKCREFELYLLIRQYTEKRDKVREAGEVLDVDASEQLEVIDYILSYLIQQASRFGVKTNPPSDEFEEPTEEFTAWYYWWDISFPELSHKHPEMIFDFMNQNPTKFDIKPEGSYLDYIDEVKKARQKYEDMEKMFDELKAKNVQIDKKELEEFLSSLKEEEKGEDD